MSHADDIINALRAIRDKTRELEEEYDGEGGKPKFVEAEILDYMNKTDIFDPEVAFKSLKSTELAEWEENKPMSGLNKDNLGESMAEYLEKAEVKKQQQRLDEENDPDFQAEKAKIIEQLNERFPTRGSGAVNVDQIKK